MCVQEKVFDNAEEAVKGYRDYVAQEQERLDSLKHTQGQVSSPTSMPGYLSVDSTRTFLHRPPLPVPSSGYVVPDAVAGAKM